MTIGGKNWLFTDNDAAAAKHARLGSLIATVASVTPSMIRRGIWPACRRKIGQTTASELEQFRPDIWKKEDATEPLATEPPALLRSPNPNPAQALWLWNEHGFYAAPASRVAIEVCNHESSMHIAIL